MSLNTRSKFMMVVSITFGIYAILWGLAPYENFNLPARIIINISAWSLDDITAPFDKNTMWLSSIGAGLIGAVSIFLGGIVVPAIKQGNKAIIRTTIIAMIFWYVIDSAGSVAAGVVSNVFFNSIYLVLVLVPLIGASKEKPHR